jgi:hypothetical protein
MPFPGHPEIIFLRKCPGTLVDRAPGHFHSIGFVLDVHMRMTDDVLAAKCVDEVL